MGNKLGEKSSGDGLGMASMIQPHVHKLAGVKYFILDMDGTVFLGDKLLPGALDFIDLLQQRELGYLFLTNNSSKHRGQYTQKLNQLGLKVSQDQIFTSGEATAIYILSEKPGARIYLVGTPALVDEFMSYGLNLVEQDPDIVVLGFDTTLTYQKLWKLCDFVRAGLPYIATHPDINCPIEGGYMPDIGAMIAFVEASTERSPDVVVGKPNRIIVESLVERTVTPIESLCMVGDRLYTDIALGKTGMITVLVLSGETKLDDLPGAVHQPDYVMQDLAELTQVLRQI
jgi:4-nitrophenyl phosphatase/NagD protein